MHSVGIVTPQQFDCGEPLTLACGQTLPHYRLVYETYGTLNADASNAVLICHALSGNHHAAGKHAESDAKPGWWDNAIGPGKAIDTDRFFVVCPNNLGGCSGSTGPTTLREGTPWGPDFPMVTVNDWVDSQAALADHLGIQTWYAVVGGSLGGMQVMDWAIRYPGRLTRAVVIASAPKLSAQNIAFNEIARQAIRSDPDFAEGRYLEAGTVPRRGLALARMLGHITYLSDDGLAQKFGRDLREGKLGFNYDVQFEVESYLRYQGQAFVDRFDANTYLLMTKALDHFDPAGALGGDLAAALAQATAQFLVVSFSSDWRFAPERSHEIVAALIKNNQRVSYAEIESEHGHDSFLLPLPDYLRMLKGFMEAGA